MRKGFMMVMVVFCLAGIATAALADSATKDEVVLKCKQAALMVKEKGIDAAIKEVGNKEGKFVWKDTYVFLMDMDGKMLAHPIKPELTQQKTTVNITDPDGKALFVDFIKLANDQGEGWVDYRWPKPGEDKPVEKSSYIYRVPGTQYFVGAGIYK